MHRQQPYSRTQASFCGKHRRSRHSLRTGNKQGASEVSFMGKLISRFQQILHILSLQQTIISRHLLYRIFTQTDIQQFPFTHELLILCKEKSQLRQLQTQGHIRPDNISFDIEGILLPHQSRRNINSHDLCRRSIDILHHGSKATTQRLVQSTTEQSVDNHMVNRQHGRDEL